MVVPPSAQLLDPTGDEAELLILAISTEYTPRDLDAIALRLTMTKLAMEMAFRPNDELDATLKRLAAKQGKSVSCTAK